MGSTTPHTDDARPRLVRIVVALVLAGLGSTAALAVGGLPGKAGDEDEPPGRTADGQYVVWAVGDSCRRRDTALGCDDVAAQIAKDSSRDALLMLGDAQYESGTLSEYQSHYQPKMGSLKSLTYPVPGNHDYYTSGAKGYFDYFGSRAGPRGKGYYAVDLGGWRLVAANSMCSKVGGCSYSSIQGSFVRDQIRNSPGSCELVFAHHPVFSDGKHGDSTAGKQLFEIAYGNRAELYLAGHDHGYQRFVPKRPDGTTSNTGGVASFVVGTGGGELTGFGVAKRSAYRQGSKFGALRLVLDATGWSASFVAVDGTVMDTASGTCRA